MDVMTHVLACSRSKLVLQSSCLWPGYLPSVQLSWGRPHRFPAGCGHESVRDVSTAEIGTHTTACRQLKGVNSSTRKAAQAAEGVGQQRL